MAKVNNHKFAQARGWVASVIAKRRVRIGGPFCGVSRVARASGRGSAIDIQQV